MSNTTKYSEQDVLNDVYDADNHVLKTGATLAGDIEIGAVEIKNATDDTRATVTTRGSKGAVGVEILDASGNQVTSFGSSFTDDSAFTPASSSITPVGGTYRSVRDSVDDNDAGALAMNAKRGLYVSPESPNGDSLVDDTYDAVKTLPSSYATDDSAMPATPVTIPVSGEYRASATTYADGDATVLQTDVNGNTKMREQYAPGYEDNTNNVAKVEQRFSYSAVAVADVQIKSSAGFLHSVTFSCADAIPTAGDIKIFDNTAESGTLVFHHNFTVSPFMPFTIILDYVMATGIYIGFTTTADVNVSCAYR